MAPPITVEFGEAITATTTSLTPRAASSSRTCWAGSSTEAIAPRTREASHNLERRQITLRAVLQRQRSGDDGGGRPRPASAR